MPESPEVEAFARWLLPRFRGHAVTDIEVLKPRLVRPLFPARFRKALKGARLQDLHRLGKHLLWHWVGPDGRALPMASHLGMTGSWEILPAGIPLPRHAAVVFRFDDRRLVLDDPRQFGALHLGSASAPAAGPDPLDPAFTPEALGEALVHDRRPIKVCLMDPARLAGVGNLYASEALFLSGIDPTRPARSLSSEPIHRLHRVLVELLTSAVERNLRALESGHPMLYRQGGLQASPADGGLWVYDREGEPCRRCGTPIVRFTQSGRSTYHCPRCQRS